MMHSSRMLSRNDKKTFGLGASHMIKMHLISMVPVFLLCALKCTVCEMVNMKIVDEPSNYGMHHYNFGGSYNTDEDVLKARIKPANFSGPSHLRRLYGKCFSKTDDSYKYEFCPFYNVTQHEQSFRWNPYKGVLGVWQEWEIINNTFTAMVMREGDQCGEHFRTAKVIFVCGQKNEVINVTEPHTCNYHVKFTSPYVCHAHSMLVYPTLAEKLQEKWDYLLGEYTRKEITKKGYDKMLHKIFEEAGYQLSNEALEKISKLAAEQEKKIEQEETGQFETLLTCTQEYQKLKKEIEGLRALIQLNEDTEHDKDKKNETLNIPLNSPHSKDRFHHIANDSQT